jgi:2,3-bisphosphoglycerate-independent phosphoglycerate mutase
VPKKSDAKGPAKGRRKPKTLWVIDERGRRRFLRGMITHELVSHGFAFDDAFAIASAVRERLADRQEVGTAEIEGLTRELLVRRLGPAALEKLAGPPPAPPIGELTVVYHGLRLPFSRGLLARSLMAAGLDLDLAYRRVIELEVELRRTGARAFSSDEVARRVGELLERQEPAEISQRYRLLRRIRKLPKPIVVYLGGASGTGKSTLALELAPLLRIYRVNATDTMRQVMRSLFPPQILPSIHRSTFEPKAGFFGDEPDAERGDPNQEIIGAFSEQAERVSVAVRAVVERAIAENMSIVVEGVHLLPPIVPFADLEDKAFQIPLMLATPDVDIHRSRFISRRGTNRRGERYLENFQAIRWIQDFLLEQAEAEDVPLLDTSFGDVTGRALRRITAHLRQLLPPQGHRGLLEQVVPALVVFIDGLADRPVKALGGRTPLQAAATPTLDRLAAEGQIGQVDAIEPEIVADTAAGSLALFGQPPRLLARGPIEAIGAGLELRPSDVALRANFATLDAKGRILDRRAGRLREESPRLAAMLDGMLIDDGEGQVEVRVAAGTEHRLAVVLRGEGLSAAILGSDPEADAAIGRPPQLPRPLDPGQPEAARTARLLAIFEERARQLLAAHPANLARRRAGLPPANAILTRGAGRLQRLVPLEVEGVPLAMTCIAGDRTVLGIAALLGARALIEEGMTGNLDTDLEAKFRAAATALATSDLVVVHIKGADIASHDLQPKAKVELIERLDAALGRLLESFSGRLRVAVTCDHATLSETGQHAADPLPLLLWGEGFPPDGVKHFDEKSAAHGSLGRQPLQTVLSRLFPLS